MFSSLILLILTACGSGSEAPTLPEELAQIYLKTDLTQLEVCSSDQPCSDRYESCTYYDGSKARCYKSGEEGDIVGCTRGELIILQTYPGQVSCLES